MLDFDNDGYFVRMSMESKGLSFFFDVWTNSHSTVLMEKTTSVVDRDGFPFEVSNTASSMTCENECLHHTWSRSLRTEIKEFSYIFCLQVFLSLSDLVVINISNFILSLFGYYSSSCQTKECASLLIISSIVCWLCVAVDEN